MLEETKLYITDPIEDEDKKSIVFNPGVYVENIVIPALCIQN